MIHVASQTQTLAARTRPKAGPQSRQVVTAVETEKAKPNPFFTPNPTPRPWPLRLLGKLGFVLKPASRSEVSQERLRQLFRVIEDQELVFQGADTVMIADKPYTLKLKSHMGETSYIHGFQLRRKDDQITISVDFRSPGQGALYTNWETGEKIRAPITANRLYWKLKHNQDDEKKWQTRAAKLEI